MLKTYNKLVRDLIPEIIEKGGNKCVISVLDDEKYFEMLNQKLNEEVNEYQADKSVEELADILEVINAIAVAKGISFNDIEKVRLEKREKRGGFENKIFLHTVTEK